MSPEWRKINLILSLTGEKLELKRQPLPTIPTDLLALFDRAELKKYMTEEELAVLDEQPTAPASKEEGH
jgi:succinate dehydrogenase / fumarate reductase flavoprotein subunit